MKIKQNFFDEIDTDWGDLISDIYSRSHDTYSIIYKFNNPVKFNEVDKSINVLEIIGTVKLMKAKLLNDSISINIEFIINCIKADNIKIDNIPEDKYVIQMTLVYFNESIKNYRSKFNNIYNLFNDIITYNSYKNYYIIDPHILYSKNDNTGSMFVTHEVTFNKNFINAINNIINNLDISYYKDEYYNYYNKMKDDFIKDMQKYK